MSEALIKELVSKILTETITDQHVDWNDIVEPAHTQENPADNKLLFEQLDPSGIIKTQTNQWKPSQEKGVFTKTLLPLDGLSPLGYGIAALKRTRIKCNFEYAEYQIMTDGILEVDIEDRIIRASAGDILYIPKNTKAVYHTLSTAKYIYFRLSTR